jgi:regulator of sigma E protease
MTLVAIGGLALLILIHEAGHFFTAIAVGMRPRKFYLGFPPPLARVRRNGVEYGIGLIPLGGYVKIPGMYRPAGRDLPRWFTGASGESEAVALLLARLAVTLDRADYDVARGEIEELSETLALAELSPPARRTAEKGIVELRDSVAPDAYWRQRAWRKIAVIFAGPATNLVLAVVLFAGVLMADASGHRLGFALDKAGRVAEVRPGEPAARVGLRVDDRVVAINGKRLDPESVSKTIRNSGTGALALTVERHGRSVTLPPAHAVRIVDKGERPTRAAWNAVKLTGLVTRDIGTSLVGLRHAEQRKQISSPLGIVRGSEEALRQGTREYLGLLGLISLSLALLNLLPLLPLDGGHIAFSLIEAVRRRAVPRAVYERASAVGLVLVLLLFFIGLSNDLGGGAGG